jgi:predicted O-methyltransferase YrrM
MNKKLIQRIRRFLAHHISGRVDFESTPHEIGIRKYGLESALKIFTHMTPEESFALFCTATRVAKNGLATEIGSYLGSSACFICRGLPKSAKLACIDTWENDAMKYDENDLDSDPRDTYEEFCTNIQKHHDKLIKIRKWSYNAVEDIRSIGRPIDFLFVDGDHSYEGVIKDWELYYPLLSKNAFVAFHDTGWAEGVQRVVAENVVPMSELHITLPNLQIFQLR